MPRLDQRGRPYSATPRVPGSYSDSNSGGHSSEAVHTPPSSHEHPLPSNIGPRTVGQITEEIELCTASLEAFAHDDPVYGQLAARLRFLRSEYVQTIVKDSNKFARRRSLVGDFPLGYFDHNQQDYYGRYDSNIQRILGPRASVSSIRRPSISVAPGNIRSSAKKLNQAAGGMYGRHFESRIPRGRSHETQSSSSADHVTAPPMGDNIVPSAEHDRGQDPEQLSRDMWDQVEDKTPDNKSNTTHTDCSNSYMKEHESIVHRLNSLAVKEPDERGSPKLKSFDEIHRELRDQDVLPPYKYSPRQQDHHQAPPPPDFFWTNFQESEVPFSPEQLEPLKCLHGWKSCNTRAACIGRGVAAASTANNATNPKWPDACRGTYRIKVSGVSAHLKDLIANVPGISQACSPIEEPADTTPVMEFPATAKLPTHKRNQSTETANEDQKPLGTKMHHIQECPHVADCNLSDSDSEAIPVIAKLGHPAKASDVKTATGFASPHNPAAPDDSMVDEFLEVVNDRFTRDEAFEILRMCGANLVAAVSVYRNAMGPEHLRQMLRAWLAPLENAEFETAARFYTENVDNQGKPWGAPSEEEVGIEEDEFQHFPSVENVRDAFARLGLQSYNSVDFDCLSNTLEHKLSWEYCPPGTQQLQQAYDTILKYQNDNDCWKLCPIPWTKSMDEKLMQWKNDDAKMLWVDIAHALSLTVEECKVRFKVLKFAKSYSDNTKEHEHEEQQQKEESVKETSVRSVTPEPRFWGALSPVNWGTAFDDNQSTHDLQPMPESTAMPASTPKPKIPAPTAYTVTYWATIESGDESVHIPVDSINVSGPEKAIIEGSAGMKKVWKWIQEKGLSDKVDLQDAFDLAKDMRGEDEDEELVGEEPQLAQDTSRALSRSSCVQWDGSRSHNRSMASSLSVHNTKWPSFDSDIGSF